MMTIQEILNTRLANQQLITSQFTTPEKLVAWLGAVQSQDYSAALWALGLRLLGSVESLINKAYDEGKILRTHIMRPTWHFVSPEDIVWLQKLTAPRVYRIMEYYDRLLELDATFLQKTNDLIRKALQGNTYLTRTEISAYLQEHTITAIGQRLGHIVMHAELAGIICSGPRRGKQFTYALISERAPHAKKLSYEESLAELTRRYFTSRGPATVRDFSWWSGLPIAEVKKGLALNKSQLLRETVDNKEYWFFPTTSHARGIADTGFLLPNYDEYLISYKERDIFLDAETNTGIDARRNVIFNHSIIIGGKVVGGWKRELKKDAILLTYKLFKKISPEEKRIFEKATKAYGDFLRLPISYS